MTGVQTCALPIFVPHPAAHERAFVMVPMAEIAATLTHPKIGRTIAEILAGLPAGDQEEVRLQATPEGWPQPG